MSDHGDALNKMLGDAWDKGFDTAACCYWRKPRNPYTGEMNDAADDYCSEHGGTAEVDHCEHDAHPIEPHPDCIHAPGCLPDLGYHRQPCPQHIPPITFPEIRVDRGGIQYLNEHHNKKGPQA